MTPSIPEWVRSFRLQGYRSAYELCPSEPRLFGTESLYGDWNAHTLLLAKDFGAASLVTRRLEQGDPRPYRHDPSLKTNRVLQRYVDPRTRSPNHASCGFLYGSALACLLRDDEKMSGSLPNRAAALAFGADVFRFVRMNLPHLRRVMCLGREAWEVTASAEGLEAGWSAARDAGTTVISGGLVFVASYHPAARVSREAMDRPWQLAQGTLTAAA
ncbi:MAG: hypothetical protein AAF108_10335 [Planctomycetota bacterium]